MNFQLKCETSDNDTDVALKSQVRTELRDDLEIFRVFSGCYKASNPPCLRARADPNVDRFPCISWTTGAILQKNRRTRFQNIVFIRLATGEGWGG